MPTQEMTYNGRKIAIKTEGDDTQLTIDGEIIPFTHVRESDEYIPTRHLGFKSYSSLMDLAKDVVDSVINRRRS